MKWALTSGYFMGAAEIGAATGGRRITILENEITMATKALTTPDLAPANQAKIHLDQILTKARATVDGGGNMNACAVQIRRVWEELERELRRSGPVAVADAVSAGLNLGWAYMRCAAKAPSEDIPKNIKGAREWLYNIKETLEAKFRSEYGSHIERLLRDYKALPPGPNELLTFAHFIDGFYGRVRDSLPPP